MITRFPIDYDALKKGDVITRDRLEQITGRKAGSKDYQLRLLSLQSQIEREMAHRGQPWTIKITKDEIRILTDPEASTYNHALQVQARCAMEKRYQLNSSVDVAQLTDDQRSQHERMMEIDGKYLLAITSVRKQLKLTAHSRSTPRIA